MRRTIALAACSESPTVRTATAARDAVKYLDDDAASPMFTLKTSLSSPLPGHPHLSVRQEEAGRLSGDFAAPSSAVATFDKEARRADSAKLLQQGAVWLLEPGSKMLVPFGRLSGGHGNSRLSCSRP
ncbi:unnamed protein product [Polarella glacialis]|uniref:Uncharacterized protein n=1 Tax=Polarella glacialis TaxID=89957 RepID=A0A813HJR5_POLGL|nr:unnamed protein product [Polarella glacialis]